MTFKQYIKDKAYLIGLTLVVVIFVSLLFGRTQTNFAISFSVVLGIVAISMTVLLVEWFRRNSFYKQLISNLNSLDKKYLMHEVLPNSHFIDGDILSEVIQDISKSMADTVATYKENQDDYLDYVEMWIHEVKTPLAAISLIAMNNPSESMRVVKDETVKLERYLDQVLYYARSSSLEKDYTIQKISLDVLVPSVVKGLSTQFIKKSLSILMEHLDVVVYSDPKWLEFILKQIVENAIKYSNEGQQIIIEANERSQRVDLVIQDFGVGIPSTDISRVFDRGFTGKTGRQTKQATGFGLYLAKRLSDKIGVGLAIQSDNSTRVTISFPKSDMMFR